MVQTVQKLHDTGRKPENCFFQIGIYYWTIGQLAKAAANTTYQALSDKAQKALTSEPDLRDCGEAGVWKWTIRAKYRYYAKAHHTNYNSL